jgi:hypothetical protein
MCPRGDHRICWLALIQRCNSHCTVLSEVAVEVGPTASGFRIVEDNPGLSGYIGLN